MVTFVKGQLYSGDPSSKMGGLYAPVDFVGTQVLKGCTINKGDELFVSYGEDFFHVDRVSSRGYSY